MKRQLCTCGEVETSSTRVVGNTTHRLTGPCITGVGVGSVKLSLGSGPVKTWTIDDPVHHPSHYTDHPSGVECLTITEHMSFLRGNAMKYLWRAGKKKDAIVDLEKAVFYIQREIQNLKTEWESRDRTGEA